MANKLKELQDTIEEIEDLIKDPQTDEGTRNVMKSALQTAKKELEDLKKESVAKPTARVEQKAPTKAPTKAEEKVVEKKEVKSDASEKAKSGLAKCQELLAKYKHEKSVAKERVQKRVKAGKPAKLTPSETINKTAKVVGKKVADIKEAHKELSAQQKTGMISGIIATIKSTLKGIKSPAKKNAFIGELVKEINKLKTKGYESGGYMEEGGHAYHDLFEHHEMMPPEVAEVFEHYGGYDVQEMSYKELQEMLDAMENVGYTFEYGLDGEPYGLRPMGVDISEVEGYGDDYAKGGKTKDEPKVVRGFFEDEEYEYARGGKMYVKSKSRDKGIKAKGIGTRISNTGREYTEYRLDHADRDRRKKLEDGGYMEKGGQIKDTSILEALRGYNVGLDKNGIAENLGISNYRFGKYATESEMKNIEKELGNLIKSGYVEEGGIGYKITYKGARHLDTIPYEKREAGGYMAKGGKTKDEPKVVRGFFEDEEYEYARGGKMYVKSKSRDKGIKAKGIGTRISNTGREYTEYRLDHADRDRREKLEDGGYMAKGGIYSSENLYIVKVFDGESGELLDMSHRVFARNLKQADRIAKEDFEDEMKAKYGDYLRFRVEEAPQFAAEGGNVAKNKRLSKNQREYNMMVDNYHWFVVDLQNKKAISGWEYKEDAKDALNDYDGDSNFKLVSERMLKSMGVENPKNDFKYADGGYMAGGGRIKPKPINYNSYDNRSLDYLLGEISHTERSARQFSNIGDMESAKDRQDHAKKLWNIYYEKKGQAK